MVVGRATNLPKVGCETYRVLRSCSFCFSVQLVGTAGIQFINKVLPLLECELPIVLTCDVLYSGVAPLVMLQSYAQSPPVFISPCSFSSRWKLKSAVELYFNKVFGYNFVQGKQRVS